MENLNELKKLIEECGRLHAVSMDESLDEETTDAAYVQYHAATDKAAEIIIGLIGVDMMTAKRMAHHKRDEIVSLINRTAA